MPGPKTLAPALLLALLAPLAAAAPSALSLSSAEPVHLEGELAARAPEATLRLNAQDLSGAARVLGATGALHVLTWREVLVEAPGALPYGVPVHPERERVETFSLANATLEVRLGGEPLVLVAKTGPGGEASVGGTLYAEGRPAALPYALPVFRVPAPLRPREVEWSWDAGWLFVGEMAGDFEGFPRWHRPEGGFSGPVELLVQGGNLSFVDRDGRAVSLRLGTWEEEPGPRASAPQAPARVLVGRRVIFEGEVSRASVPLEGWWGLAAPAMAWDLEGTARWESATGAARHAGARAAFADAAVEARGRFAVHPHAPRGEASALAPDRFEAEGEIESLRIGGRSWGREGASFSAVGVGSASVVVLLLLLAKAAWALYARIARSDLLENPRRRRVYEEACASPGIHARELQRRAGGAWGAFSLHLRLLVAGRYLRVQRQGRYRLVFPAGPAAAEEPRIPHPVARSVFEALPADGARVRVVDCRRRLGVSRQLLDYHLRALVEKGLVVLVQDSRSGDRLVARRVAAAGEQSDAPQS